MFNRKKEKQVPNTKTPVRVGSPKWLPIAMLTCFAVGILWIVIYNIEPSAPIFFKSLDGLNMLLGFVPIVVGFFLAFRWK